MKVFVLFTQVVFDCEDSSNVEVFSTKEKAMSAFHEFVAREKKNAEDDGWEIELSEDSFEAFEDGCYAENRVLASVSELEVK
jgi:hypothetical protein